MQLTITGQTPSKKNSRRPFVRNGRVMNFPSKRHEAWLEGALWELKRYQPIKGKVLIDYKFYCKDMRKRDVDNMLASINDALVKAGIIKDDSWQTLMIGSAVGELDRENPRAVMRIHEA